MHLPSCSQSLSSTIKHRLITSLNWKEGRDHLNVVYNLFFFLIGNVVYNLLILFLHTNILNAIVGFPFHFTSAYIKKFLEKKNCFGA